MNVITKKKILRFLKDPLNVAWVVFSILLIFIMVFFDFFRQHFIKLSLIGIFLSVFHYIDSKIFKPIGENAQYFFSANPFAKKWKSFPIFLAEVYLAYFSAIWLDKEIKKYVTVESIQRWHVLAWLAIMFLLYWYERKDEK